MHNFRPNRDDRRSYVLVSTNPWPRSARARGHALRMARALLERTDPDTGCVCFPDEDLNERIVGSRSKNAWVLRQFERMGLLRLIVRLNQVSWFEWRVELVAPLLEDGSAASTDYDDTPVEDEDVFGWRRRPLASTRARVLSNRRSARP